MKRGLGIALLILGGAVLIIFGFWSLILDLRILHALGGFWAAALGFCIFPAMLVFAPFYAGSVYGYWDPLIVSLVSLVAWPLIAIGMILIDPK